MAQMPHTGAVKRTPMDPRVRSNYEGQRKWGVSDDTNREFLQYVQKVEGKVQQKDVPKNVEQEDGEKGHRKCRRRHKNVDAKNSIGVKDEVRVNVEGHKQPVSETLSQSHKSKVQPPFQLPLKLKSASEATLRVPSLNAHQLCVCQREHIQVLMKRSSRNPSAVFMCKLCKYHCDNWTVVENHIKQPRHDKLREERADQRSTTLLPNPAVEQTESITKLIMRVQEEHGIGRFHRFRRQMLVSRIDMRVRQVAHGCSLKMYGSSVTSIGLRTSDVNINLTVPPGINGPSVMNTVFQMLMKDVNAENVEFDVASDVPRIVFVDGATKLCCTLCLGLQNAVDISELLAKYESIDDRVLPLAVAFRLWANMCGLDRVASGTLPAYAYALMIVYYLQQIEEPVLPVLHELLQKPNSVLKPELYLKGDVAINWKSSNTLSVGELWLGLLKFYLIDFKMGEKVICIQSSKPLLRSAKKWNGNKIAIEDPFIPKRNLSKTIVHMSCFDYLISCLHTTYKYFATPQTAKGPIFHQIQPLAESVPKLAVGDNEANFLVALKNPVFVNNQQFSQGDDITNKLQGVTLADTTDASLTVQIKAPITPVNVDELDLAKLIVNPHQAAIMYQKLNSTFLMYSFERCFFTAEKELPTVCVLCHEEGHSRTTCPHENLPPLEMLPPITSVYLNALTATCEIVFDDWALRKEEYHHRQEIVTELEEYVGKFYSGAVLKMFGSSCNGFGLHKSDLDICLTFKHNDTGEGLHFADIIEDLYRNLQRYPKLHNLVPITTAKVPILKFYHPDSQLEGDISLYNTLGQVNTCLLRTYADVDKRVQILGHVMKRFAKICDICDASRGSLSSYAYMLMVIFFLQQCNPPVLPILQKLHHSGTIPLNILQGCNVYFFEDISNLPTVWSEYGKNNESVGALWIQLLCFYTEVFDFQNYVISIRQKQPLKKFEKFWNAKCMAIEDPFDLNHNLGAALSRRMHNYIMLSLRKGRFHFGMTKDLSMLTVSQLTRFFFNHESLRVGAAPYDRGCSICKKIGHMFKNCPSKKQNSRHGDSNRPEQNIVAQNHPQDCGTRFAQNAARHSRTSGGRNVRMWHKTETKMDNDGTSVVDKHTMNRSSGGTGARYARDGKTESNGYEQTGTHTPSTCVSEVGAKVQDLVTESQNFEKHSLSSDHVNVNIGETAIKQCRR